MNDAGITAEERATAVGAGRYAVLTDLFCTPARCPVIVGDQLVYRDDNHLPADYATWLAPVIDAHITVAMAGG